MPAVARASGKDTIMSPHGNPSPKSCQTPAKYKTLEGASKVFVEGTPVVILGKKMQPHPDPGQRCAPHQPALTSGSGKVFVEGKPLGRIGDVYEGHPLVSGSSKVFSG